MVDSVGAMAKKHFDEARVFEHYGMICLALDEIVSDGVVEATNWDTIRRGIKLKMSACPSPSRHSTRTPRGVKRDHSY